MQNNSIHRSTLPMRPTRSRRGRIVALGAVGTVASGLLALVPAPSQALTPLGFEVVAGEHLHELPDRVPRPSRGTEALAEAVAHEGAPYVWGASGPSGFDCSGLTSFAYREGGTSVPRTAAEQAAYARRIPADELQPGDFVFFYSGSHVYHVGLYDGMVDGVRYIVHAPFPGAVVRREAIWTTAWFAGTLR